MRLAPRYPHVHLDVEFLSSIPQVRRKWLARFQQHDGVVVDMVEKFLQGFAKRLRERGGGGRGRPAARVPWGAPQPSPPPYIGVGGSPCPSPKS